MVQMFTLNSVRMGNQSRRWTTLRASVWTLDAIDADVLLEADELNDYRSKKAIMSYGMGRLVRARVDDTEDRISKLPDVLLTHILSRLPVKTVIRTSVLSRRWNPVWASVPSLELTISDFLPRGIGLSNRMRRQVNFFNFVQQFLRRNSPCFIQKLHLDCPPGYVPTGVSSVILVWSQLDPRLHENRETPLIRHSNLESWVILAEGYKVRHLYISCSEDMLLSRLIGSNFYNFENLVSLVLTGYMVLHIPVSSIIFPKLKILKLVHIEFKDNYSLSYLINSCCPMLDDLFVCSDNENNFRRLVISAKSLTRIDLQFVRRDFSDNVSGTRIDVPNLQFLGLQNVLIADNHVAGVLGGLDRADLDISSEDDLRWLLKRIRKVKILTLSEFTLMSLDSCTFPVFYNLTCLDIEACDDAFPRWEVLFRILKNLPILEDLYLEELKFGHRRPFDWAADHDIPRCLIACLKTIEINIIYGEKEELRIVGYLLKHSQVLRKMKVQIDKKCTETTEKIVKRILALPKGSPECDVIVMSRN